MYIWRIPDWEPLLVSVLLSLSHSLTLISSLVISLPDNDSLQTFWETALCLTHRPISKSSAFFWKRDGNFSAYTVQQSQGLSHTPSLAGYAICLGQCCAIIVACRGLHHCLDFSSQHRGHWPGERGPYEGYIRARFKVIARALWWGGCGRLWVSLCIPHHGHAKVRRLLDLNWISPQNFLINCASNCSWKGTPMNSFLLSFLPVWQTKQNKTKQKDSFTLSALKITFGCPMHCDLDWLEYDHR